MTAGRFTDESRNVATGRPIAVLPSIYEVRESLAPAFKTPDCWVSLWLLVDSTRQARPAIIDTGVPRSAESVIVPALDALGYQPWDLEVAVCTHSHHDHAGSNVPLRQATGCKIWIHRDDAPALERGARFGDEPIEPHRADRLLEEGEMLRLAGRDYEVIHLPGHSPGSIGLYDRKRRVLFTGDALQAQGTTTQGIAGVPDRDAYYRTLDKVDALDIEHLFPAHPYLPFVESHVHPRSEVRRYLAECRRFVDEIDGEILAALRSAGAPATADDLADRLCRARGFPAACQLTARILTVYLERLARAGQVRRTGEGVAARWAAAA